MTTVHLSRRRVALRLLLLEAGLLAGILGGFTLVAIWRAGVASLEAIVLLGAALIPVVLVAEWLLVRSQWKRARSDFGGDERGP